jgi:hypothetical protein
MGRMAVRKHGGGDVAFVAAFRAFDGLTGGLTPANCAGACSESCAIPNGQTGVERLIECQVLLISHKEEYHD